MSETDGIFEEVTKELMPFESWERLSGESSAAFAAFCAYRDYGPDRNIRKAVEAEFKNGDIDLAEKPENSRALFATIRQNRVISDIYFLISGTFHSIRW
jgi:hypothetical protein